MRPTALYSHKLPLRLVLIVPFVLQIFAAVGLTGWLSLRNGQKSVNDVTAQLRNEITARIEQNLKGYLELPHTINSVNEDVIQLGKLNINDQNDWRLYIWKQLQSFPSVNYISFGSEKGHYTSVDRTTKDGSFRISWLTEAPGDLHIYATDRQGDRAEVLDVFPNYDPRRRPWYTVAVQQGKATWSKIHTLYTQSILAMNASQPFYDEAGTLQGVLTVNFSLAQIGDFLRSLKIGKSGQTFIIERSGELVASSAVAKPFAIVDQKTAKRLKATEIDAPLIRATAQYLQQQFGDLTQIKTSHQLSFISESQREFVQVVPFSDGRNLDWLIVVVVPEADFMEQINANTRTTLLLCFGALVVATGLGILTSRWIARPILRLKEASEAICNGQLNQKVEVQGISELEVLATSFNKMALQLEDSFSALEIRVEQRTAELKKAKEEAEKAKVVADTASKAKSEFLANMSHELRTPLNGILGYAQILILSRKLEDEERRSVNIIHQCGNHLLTLINDILDLSKIEAKKLEIVPTDFHFPAFLLAVAEICRIRAEQKSLKFNYQPDPDLPTGIRGDEKRLRQVLINLLGNAIKFTRIGAITFQAALIEKTRNDSGDLLYKIRFTVQDSGVGIKPEELEKIFLPFEQVGDTKRQAEGTGLGLAISQKIVQQMGSSLQVTSQPQMGSTFWFDVVFPEAENWATSAAQSEEGAIINYVGRRQKILVVDDRWENRSVIINLLTPIGFEVKEAVNGRDGLETAKQWQPDLMITDIVMPELDGLELIKIARQTAELKEIKIITSSASVYQTDQHQCLLAGSDDFLPKPVQAEELLTKLQQHLQLQWIYHKTKILLPEDEPQELIAPPPEELETLMSMARRGHLKGIIKHSETLEKSDRKFQPFARRLRWIQWVGQF